jgi:putative transposase
LGGRGRKTSSEDRRNAITLIKEANGSGAKIKKACGLLGISHMTYLRWTQSCQDMRKGPNSFPQKLSSIEQQRILKHAYSEEFQDKSPAFIVPALADRGIYVASESSFYRILKRNQARNHRQKSKRPIKRNLLRPIATAPNQVWSWDITYLRGPIKGQFYYLYLIIDVFSRKIIHSKIYEQEAAHLAGKVISEAARKENISKDQLILHSDNGGPMKGATMLATLQQLGIMPSFSRPSVSDDNPFSESLFKTIKYSPFYPIHPFKDIFECTKWLEYFVAWYNYSHLHSGIKFVTPNSRHEGKDLKILEKRRKLYLHAKEKNPLRWKNDIRNWSPIDQVHLNPAKEDRLKNSA